MQHSTRAADRSALPKSPTPGFLHRRYARLLASAGIEVNGNRPWDLRVHDERMFARCLRDGTLGFGDAYVDGWWDAPALDELFARLITARLDERAPNLPRAFAALRAALTNLQTRYRARTVAETHYDLGNELYRAMLGETMVYTCGWWAQAATLDEAQRAKLDLVCRKLNLAPGMRVLDIGCGWGSFARHAAAHYGAKVVGVTISGEQATLARELCTGHDVDIRLQDYRDVEGRFDRIVSLGMFEHVGRKNYRIYMQTARRLLEPDGLFLLHTIGRNDRGAGIDPWITRYIFPNSEIPSLNRLSLALDHLFVVEDLHNFGADYARTLCAWRDNFVRAWPAFTTRMPSDFYRRWTYYLSLFIGVFRARGLQLWQVVLSPHGIPGGYRRPA
ncbi:MAG: cyclopropane fatty acyl phospholipid synthase [Gammaproteobacteria bacterium]|nr:cyclopropane fatty acyl phospholipid synthase [Gammaproteobacteria bacterium]